MMRRLPILMILTFLIVLQGCTSKRPLLTKQYPDLTYRQLLELHDQWINSIRTLSAKGRITIDSPSYSGKFEADIYASGRDSLLISVKGLFGANVGKVFIGKERFIFYNQYENQFITGQKSDFENMNFLQFPLSLNELQQVFLARDEFNILKKEKFEKKPDGYFLSAKNGRFHYHIWFDANTLLIKRIEYYNDQKLLFFKEYRQFSKKNGVLFPRVINFVRPDEKQGVSIIFSQIEINKPLDGQVFQIKVSESAKQLIIPSSNS
ncbi:DUF4292 domain-containing protein [Caldithrix abyssi]